MRGGRLNRLGEVQFKSWWIVPIIAFVQYLIIRFMNSPSRLKWWHPRPLIMIASYVMLWIVIWRNRHLPGMWIVLAGVTLNLSVIAANGGYMPIPPEVLARVGGDEIVHQLPAGSPIFGSKDVLLAPQQAHLWFLGDVLAIPAPYPWPTAMSVGDWALAIGVFWFIVQISQSNAHASEKGVE
jgi:hypothetical protein